MEFLRDLFPDVDQLSAGDEQDDVSVFSDDDKPSPVQGGAVYFASW